MERIAVGVVGKEGGRAGENGIIMRGEEKKEEGDER